MKRVLAIEDKLAAGEELDLSNDRPSCKLFWGTLLDHACAENADTVIFCPDDRDNSITVVIDGLTYPVVPLPYEVQEMFLRYAQEIALGNGGIPYSSG